MSSGTHSSAAASLFPELAEAEKRRAETARWREALRKLKGAAAHVKVSIRDAAADVGKNRAFIQQLIETGALGSYKMGGSAARPHLNVYLDEARSAVDDATRYLPPALARAGMPERRVRPARRSASVSSLHPQVASATFGDRMGRGSDSASPSR